MKRQYVLAFATMIPHVDTQFIVAVERIKQDWQFGKLNLPGGEVYGGEPIEKAALRELQEETTLVGSACDTKIVGLIEGQSWQAHVCMVPYRDWHSGGRQTPQRIRADEGPVHYVRWSILKDDPRLLPELKIIIPLCNSRLEGWHIWADDPDKRESMNQFKVTV